MGKASRRKKFAELLEAWQQYQKHVKEKPQLEKKYTRELKNA